MISKSRMSSLRQSEYGVKDSQQSLGEVFGPSAPKLSRQTLALEIKERDENKKWQ